jgi:hypothetical protein
MSELLCRQNYPNHVSHLWFPCFETRWLWFSIRMIRIVLRQQVSHLLLICTNLGYGTALTAACARWGCSATHYLLLFMLCIHGCKIILSIITTKRLCTFLNWPQIYEWIILPQESSSLRLLRLLQVSGLRACTQSWEKPLTAESVCLTWRYVFSSSRFKDVALCSIPAHFKVFAYTGRHYAGHKQDRTQ